MPVLFNFLIIAGVFSLLIIVHEFGHFIAARLFKVHVTDFAIGFGPALFRRKIRRTVFRICWIPLGGYIKMAGDSRSECRGYKEEFFSKAAGIRSLIVLAGPFFNYFLAFIMLVIVATAGFPVQDTVVGGVKKGSSAAQAGVEPGDKIVSLDGSRLESWPQLEQKIHKARSAVEIKLARDGKVISLKVPLKREEITDRFGRKVEVSQTGLLAYGTSVGEVLAGYPAEEAGLQKGDKIVKVGGKEVGSWQELSESIQNSSGPLLLEIERGGRRFSRRVPVKKEKLPNVKNKEEYVSVIGIRPPLKEKILKTAFPFSLAKGAKILFSTTALSLEGLWYMITDPSISFRESIAGPIYISYMISKTASIGWVPLFQLISLLNIFLFIVNLFPIPVFDGGHILFFGIERIRGKPLSQKTEDNANRIGMALIMLLMFFVFYNDIVKRGPQIWKEIKGSFADFQSNEKE